MTTPLSSPTQPLPLSFALEHPGTTSTPTILSADEFFSRTGLFSSTATTATTATPTSAVSLLLPSAGSMPPPTTSLPYLSSASASVPQHQHQYQQQFQQQQFQLQQQQHQQQQQQQHVPLAPHDLWNMTTGNGASSLVGSPAAPIPYELPAGSGTMHRPSPPVMTGSQAGTGGGTGGSDMLAVMAALSAANAKQEDLRRQLDMRNEETRRIQDQLAAVEHSHRVFASLAGSVVASPALGPDMSGMASMPGSGAFVMHRPQFGAHERMDVDSFVLPSASYTASPALPPGSQSQDLTHLAPFLAPPPAMGSAMAASMTPPTYTPSDAFSRMSVHMSMTHQEPFSPLTSPVFHSHYPPTSGVGADQPPGSGILGPAAMPGMSSAGDRLDSLPPPTVPSSASISAVGISRPEVTMDWLSMDASGNLVVSQAGATMHHQHQPLYQHQQQHQHPAESDFHSMFAAAASAAATANASDSPTGLTPAALMMGGGALSPADGAALQKQQQQRHSSSPVTATLTLVPPSALHSPSSPVPPGVTVARSRSTSGSPIPLGLPSAVVAAAGSSAGVPRRRTSGGMVSSSKAASKLAAAPYVRHSPRLAPVSGSPAGALGPGSPIGLGGGGGPMSPAMLPRSSLASGADMRAAIVNSPGLLPMAAVTIPATAMHGGTPHLPPTPNSAPMNPYTAGTVHSTSATPYMGGSMHGTPPLLPMVSPALHPSAYQSHTSGYYGHHQQQHGGQYPNAAAATAPLPLPSPALPPGKGLRITSVSSDSVPVSTATTQQQPPTPGFHHEPHMINLTGLGGYTTLGLGHGMLLHEFAPPAAAPSSSRRAGGTAAAGSDDDEDDEDDEGKKNTHRFAEQKRRNAMKDGFDELRRRIPGLQNSVTNRKSKFGGGAAAAPEPPEPLGAGARRRRGRDAKNEGKGISKIMVLKAAYDYCAFMSSRERRLRQTVQQLAAAANANANAVAALRAATAGIGHSVAVPEIPLTPAVPADLLQSSDDIFFTYVKETLWKSASAQTQAAGEILAVTDGPLSPRSAPSSVTDMAASVAVAPTAAMASGPQQQQLISPADSMLVDDPAAMAAALANAGSVAAAVAAISSATGSTPAVAKAVVQKVTSSSRGSSIRYQQQQQQQAQLAQQQQADT